MPILFHYSIDDRSKFVVCLHGSGLRLTNLDGSKLEPVMTVRNTAPGLTRVQGRIIYTRADGTTGTVEIPQKPIAAGKTQTFSLANLVTNLPPDAAYGGIELEYDTPKGTIITSVQSVSKDGDHVFQVPMFDPEKMPSSAGGFPWKADGDFTTIVYIKNETDTPRRYAAHLLRADGQYSLGEQIVKPNQTIAIDFRSLRDSQTPDGMGRLIPLDAETGQIAWSVKGGENKVLSGRSEQISLSEGVASTYSCANCCPDSFYNANIVPDWIELDFGSGGFMAPMQTDITCNQTLLGPYTVGGANWDSDNVNVVTVLGGELFTQGVGTATISTIWETCLYSYFDCIPGCEETIKYSSVAVTPLVEINGPTQANDGSSVLFSAFVGGATPTGYQWSFTTPSGAGNDPNLNFGTPTSVSTFATAKWFALPNQECPPDPNNTTAYRNSIYTVKLTVTFSNRGPITKEKSFTVNVPWGEAGKTLGNVSPGNGGPEIDQNSSGIWYVVSLGTWNLTTNPSVHMNIPTSSQFHSKMFAHEQIHVGQWAQPNGLLGSNYSNAGLFSAIQNLTDSSKDGLLAKISTAANDYLNTQDAVVRGLCNQAEGAAYNSSDSLAPQYLYQTCGRTTFSNCP